MALDFNLEAEDHLSFPEHPSVIEKDSYQKRDDISVLSIPSSVYKISAHAFCECKKLREVYLGESISTIEEGAFKECESLSYLYLPSSITYIAEDAFDGCFEKEFGCHICGYEGSYAEKYTHEKGLPFISMVDEERLQKAKELFDKDIDSEAQVVVFREAMLNRYNPVVQAKGSLYLSIAYLIGRGVPPSDVLAEQNLSLSDSYYEFRLYSPMKNETEDQILRVKKKLETIYNGLSIVIRDLSEDVLMENKTVLQCKRELYPESLNEDEKKKLAKLDEEEKKEEEYEKSKDNSFRVLYLHGLGESKEDPIGLELKERLSYLVRTIDIPADPYYGMKKVNRVVSEYHPDLIVASDFSSLYALRMKAYSRILIHPWIDIDDIPYHLTKENHMYKTSHFGKCEYLVDDQFLDETDDIKYIETYPLGVNYAIFSENEKNNPSYRMALDLFTEENICFSKEGDAYSPTELTLDIIHRILQDGIGKDR